MHNRTVLWHFNKLLAVVIAVLVFRGPALGGLRLGWLGLVFVGGRRIAWLVLIEQRCDVVRRAQVHHFALFFCAEPAPTGESFGALPPSAERRVCPDALPPAPPLLCLVCGFGGSAFFSRADVAGALCFPADFCDTGFWSGTGASAGAAAAFAA